MAQGVADIDWSAPWFSPWRAVGEPIAKAISGGRAACDALNAVATAPVHFVPHIELPVGEPYERFIFNSKQCPTREGLHDFFNAICWISFPQTKQRLNALQAAEIAAAGVQGVRGVVRDAITLLDENAALLDAPSPLWEALVAKDWHRLFVTLRPLWARARLVVFGHAALEKLVSPRKQHAVHVYRSQFAIDSIVSLDRQMAAALSRPVLAGKPFAPLPVLGVPGWWAANADPAFYDDAAVFRPPRDRTGQPL